jgi:hypothetical protein
VLEPPPQDLLDSSQIDENTVQLLEKSIKLKHRLEIDSVTVRLHPSQTISSNLGFSPDKYLNQIKFSNRITLLEDLQRATIVVGISSYALYIAAICGKETYSVSKGNRGHWTNHFPSIKTF